MQSCARRSKCAYFDTHTRASPGVMRRCVFTAGDMSNQLLEATCAPAHKLHEPALILTLILSSVMHTAVCCSNTLESCACAWALAEALVATVYPSVRGMHCLSHPSGSNISASCRELGCVGLWAPAAGADSDMCAGQGSGRSTSLPMMKCVTRPVAAALAADHRAFLPKDKKLMKSWVCQREIRACSSGSGSRKAVCVSWVGKCSSVGKAKLATDACGSYEALLIGGKHGQVYLHALQNSNGLLQKATKR